VLSSGLTAQGIIKDKSSYFTDRLFVVQLFKKPIQESFNSVHELPLALASNKDHSQQNQKDFLIS
jgi:hypothetical protein